MIRTVIVDDEPVARTGLARLLGEDPDLELVGEATDGREALELLAAVAPDLVFLDIRMPGLDGVAVADALRRLPSSPAFVFVTAHADHAPPIPTRCSSRTRRSPCASASSWPAGSRNRAPSPCRSTSRFRGAPTE